MEKSKWHVTKGMFTHARRAFRIFSLYEADFATVLGLSHLHAAITRKPLQWVPFCCCNFKFMVKKILRRMNYFNNNETIQRSHSFD